MQEEVFIDCPGLQECFCNDAITSVFCVDKNLTTIPDIPKTTQRLHLEENRLNILHTRSFTGYPHLKYIYLSMNKITAIEAYAFEGLDNLTCISLAKNQLSSLGDYSFANIPKLEEIHLLGNDIRVISHTEFFGSTAIKTITLNSNKLFSAPYLGDQQRLRDVNLQRNLIVNATFPSSFVAGSQQVGIDLSMNMVEALTNTTFISMTNANLSYLFLSDNRISDVDPAAFSGIASVSALRLKSNPLTQLSIKNLAVGLVGKFLLTLDLSRVFHKGDNVQALISPLGVFPLETLRLASNSIVILRDNMFSKFRELTVLDLSKNYIFHCSKKAFHGLDRLSILNLADNTMQYMPENLPRTLEVLDLSKNRLWDIRNNEFESYSNLQVLNLKQNRINLFTKHAFYCLGSLTKLIVASNRIHFLSGMFESLRNLTYLDLSGNKLRSITLPKIHFKPLGSLQFLNLADNQLSNIKENIFEHLTSLRTLNLERNNFSSVVSHYGVQLLADLNRLEELYITSNNIMTLPEKFLRNQTSLKTLNADHNKMESWSPKLFKSTKKLERLDMGYNKISFIGRESLKYLYNLKYMNLNDNPFTCNCDLLWFREWLDHTSVDMAEKINYKCNGPKQWSGKKLLDFDRSKITCPSGNPIAKYIGLGVGSAAGGILFTSFAVALVYRLRWRIRLRAYLLSMRGKMFVRRIRARDQQRNYGAVGEEETRYDAYISCSEHDKPWVLQHLLPDIDNRELNDGTPAGGEFTLYYDDRDADPSKSFQK